MTDSLRCVAEEEAVKTLPPTPEAVRRVERLLLYASPLADVALQGASGMGGG
jgi:hypothetical protein